MHPIRKSNPFEQRTGSQVAGFLGGFSTLLEQVGSADAFPQLQAIQLPDISDLAGLERFLDGYLTQCLPGELAVIAKAHGYAANGQARELAELDRKVSASSGLMAFAAASRRIGQMQLQHLRPLRDHRVVQRYLAAVDSDQASGWHIVVYGLFLAVYSVPLRQGLIRHAEETLAVLAAAAARARSFPASECRLVVERLVPKVPRLVEDAISNSFKPTDSASVQDFI